MEPMPLRRSAAAPMRGRRPFHLGLCLGLGAMLAACGGGAATTLPSPPTTDAQLTLTVQRTPAGPILATGTGATLYDFGPDTRNRSTCLNDGCVYQWPPLVVHGPILVGAGVNRALVGTLHRPGGSTQLSYNGHPLYTYVLDVKPGMITGQAIDQDGGPWYVLNPAGNEIHTPFTVNG
jgi:predicted lipoprotein with Yx(FWY)xxD motif